MAYIYVLVRLVRRPEEDEHPEDRQNGCLSIQIRIRVVRLVQRFLKTHGLILLSDASFNTDHDEFIEIVIFSKK